MDSLEEPSLSLFGKNSLPQEEDCDFTQGRMVPETNQVP